MARVMSGKGDTPRPVDRAKWDAGYRRIFSRAPLDCPHKEKCGWTAEGTCPACGQVPPDPGEDPVREYEAREAVR